jgi:hypothetical protein
MLEAQCIVKSEDRMRHMNHQTATTMLFALAVGACGGPASEPAGPCGAEAEQVFYEDADGDGYGVAGTTRYSCHTPEGYALQAGDCDDADAYVHPGAQELCNGVDDDCDGVADGGIVSTWYTDADDDGYGDPLTGIEACEAPDGSVDDGTDCDDSDPNTHPGAVEVCDGDDDDCDGLVDTGEVGSWYPDGDGDGFGDPDAGALTCEPEPGWVQDGSDCDDSDPAVSPLAVEACNGVDDDCDGEVDEDFDEDGDGWGGVLCGGEDCDDGDPAIHPDADEICDDGVDDDCDGADLPCGFAGDYDLVDSYSKLYAASRDVDLARLMRVGNLDGQGGDDVLAATYHDNALLGGAYVVAGPVSGTHDVEDYAYRIEGVQYTGGAGRSIAVSDTDGDGIDDLLVGAPYGPVATAYVMLGPITADTDLDEAVGWLESYQYSFCGHGADLADVNDDGLADAVVGCYGDDSNGHLSGTVTVTYGPVDDSVYLPDDADAVLMGVGEYAGAGQYMRAGADLNGDGIGDIMSESYANENVYYGGTVFVSYGPVSGTQSLADADAQLVGEAPNDLTGFAMVAGDLDGDGQSDAVVGGFGNLTGTETGASYVVYGPISGTVALSGADAIIRGTATRSAAGLGLEMGDIEGDGIDELLVGAPSDDTVATNAGAAFLFLGPLSGSYTTADAHAAFWGEAANDLAGLGLAFADTDNDGWSEILVGAPQHGDPSGLGGALYLLQPEI